MRIIIKTTANENLDHLSILIASERFPLPARALVNTDSANARNTRIVEPRTKKSRRVRYETFGNTSKTEPEGEQG
ncbi:hypothetical protein IH824_10655 [candidate division KSB1 bacterium]|nr:hypothetical protein [candidate division KSB1 bacterium]